MRWDSVIRFILSLTGAVVIIILTASCATKKDFTEFRREMLRRSDETESRLISLEVSVAGIDSLVREQQRLSQSLRAMIGTQTQDQRENIELIAARQDEINYQLRELLQRLQAIQLYGGVETAPTEQTTAQSTASTPSEPAPVKPSSAAPSTTPQQAPAATAKVDPADLYNAALDDVTNERFQLAESRFLSFLMQFPNHELAGNAQYWLGEAVYGQGKYELAISEFEKVQKKYPKSPKVPAAILKIGFAQYELGQNRDAVQTLNRLIKAYPNSEEANLAREKLNSP